MKKTIVLLLGLTLPLFAGEADEKKAIEQTLQYYFDGGEENLKKAFHPDATLKYIRDGQHNVIPIDEFIKRVSARPVPERKTWVESIDYTGTAGFARLVVEYDDFAFVDYMALLKVEGSWKIVTKLSYRRAK